MRIEDDDEEDEDEDEDDILIMNKMKWRRTWWGTRTRTRMLRMSEIMMLRRRTNPKTEDNAPCFVGACAVSMHVKISVSPESAE